MAWVQIMISPSLIGGAAGIVLWLWLKGMLGGAIGIGCGALGVGLGAWLAEKARKANGTIEFVARIRQHPELHKQQPDSEELSVPSTQKV